MKHIIPALKGAALALALPAWLLSIPASAQETKAAPPAAPSGGGAKSAPSPAPSGGGGESKPSGGGASAGGGSVNRGGGGGSGRTSGSTGSTGYSAPRSPRASDNGSTASGTAAPRGSSGGASGGASSNPSGERGNRPGRDGNGRTNATPGANPSAAGVPAYARPKDGNEPVGTAVPRGTTPRPPTTGGIGVGIYVPGGYYGGYGYGFDPWYGGYGAGYGGYYGGYYDPWYGGYPTYPQTTYTPSIDEGSLRLKIKPREGEVYVDGYFVGMVDDFDGIFQRLHIDSGPHRIEVRAAGYEPLAFEVRITPEHTTTYQGELKRIQ